MTTASGVQFPVGLRYGVVFALNSAGRPAATTTTAYEGLQFGGPKAFTLTIPEPRKVTHVGNDRVLAVDYLPSLDSVSGEIRASKNDMDLHALLSSVLKFSVGEAAMLPWVTDEQGNEPDVGLLLYQQSLDAASRVLRWRGFVIPKTRCIAMPPGMGENPEDMRYALAPSPTTTHLWGEALAVGTEGATEQAVLEMMTEYKPKLVAFEADGVEDEFLFPAAAQAVSTDKIVAWVNGVEATSGITKATTGVTWAVAPSSGDDVVIFYEHA